MFLKKIKNTLFSKVFSADQLFVQWKQVYNRYKSYERLRNAHTLTFPTNLFGLIEQQNENLNFIWTGGVWVGGFLEGPFYKVCLSIKCA